MTPVVATDCEPVPRAFFAAILKVYDAPLVKPLRVWVVAVELKIRGVCAVPALNGVTM